MRKGIREGIRRGKEDKVGVKGSKKKKGGVRRCKEE